MSTISSNVISEVQFNGKIVLAVLAHFIVKGTTFVLLNLKSLKGDTNLVGESGSAIYPLAETYDLTMFVPLKLYFEIIACNLLISATE